MNPDSSLNYRTRIVVDGGDNVIESLTTLNNYGARKGGDLRDLYIDFELNSKQNKRLENLLGKFWKAAKKTGTQFSRDDLELTDEKRDAILSQLNPSVRKPFVSPRKTQKKEEPVSPWKPLTKRVKRRSFTYLTSDIADEIDDPDTQKVKCRYVSGNIPCDTMAKTRYIFCSHHLRVISRKYEEKKGRKRLRQSSDFTAWNREEPLYPQTLFSSSSSDNILNKSKSEQDVQIEMDSMLESPMKYSKYNFGKT